MAEWLSHSAVSKKSQVRIPVQPKVLGSDGIVCVYFPLCVYDFILCLVCMHIRCFILC